MSAADVAMMVASYRGGSTYAPLYETFVIVPLVELEWRQFDEECGRIAVARRVWAPTIGEALGMMVEDRRTDVALEEIEQAAAQDDDVSWND